MSEAAHWNQRYQSGDFPWETGQPSTELQRVIAQEQVPPGRAIDLGCGMGANAIWLAQQGFDVTGVDLSPLAIERAQERAATVNRRVNFLVADLLEPTVELGGPFDFFFDRGCYHILRKINAAVYLQTLLGITKSGSIGLVLAGNAREPEKPGPPVVTEDEIRSELGTDFEIALLREFRFDPTPISPTRPLGWACLLKRK